MMETSCFLILKYITKLQYSEQGGLSLQRKYLIPEVEQSSEVEILSYSSSGASGVRLSAEGAQMKPELIFL